MDDHQYGMMDLTQYLNGRPLFASVPTQLTSELLCGQQQHFEMVMPSTTITVPPHENCLPQHHHHEFLADSSTAAAATTRTSVSGGCTLEMEGVAAGGLGAQIGDGGNGRWPRQETLTLLEVRSRLDYKFKEANQKGPLWDEVSRIMSEEYGYQRSGKKCREKFENLYKYYKKTKEGKDGRQDRKHYRYFRQLEALCGKTSNTIDTSTFHHYNQEAHQGPKVSDSLYDSSDSDTMNSSFDENYDSKQKRKNKRRGKGCWKAKIKDYVDMQMKKLMGKQEYWMEKMMKTIEDKEQERILREEEWRKKEAIRIEKEQRFWASERAWIEARDAALIDALHKLNGEEVKKSTSNLNDKNASMFYSNKKQKDMNSLSSSCYYNFQIKNEEERSYCETSRHASNVHETIDDELF
ncbi:unnamed protein product [Withania somnifera]